MFYAITAILLYFSELSFAISDIILYYYTDWNGIHFQCHRTVVVCRNHTRSLPWIPGWMWPLKDKFQDNWKECRYAIEFYFFCVWLYLSMLTYITLIVKREVNNSTIIFTTVHDCYITIEGLLQNWCIRQRRRGQWRVTRSVTRTQCEGRFSCYSCYLHAVFTLSYENIFIM